ncbi:MAG TPA: hypothetical protein VGM68_11055 [Rhizomicrobium sp.]|jgi:hypothetical protein
MTRKQKQPKHPTAQQWEDWKSFCGDIGGEIDLTEPYNFNIAQMADSAIEELGFNLGAEYADTPSECAFRDEDRED